MQQDEICSYDFRFYNLTDGNLNTRKILHHHALALLASFVHLLDVLCRGRCCRAARLSLVVVVLHDASRRGVPHSFASFGAALDVRERAHLRRQLTGLLCAHSPLRYQILFAANKDEHSIFPTTMESHFQEITSMSQAISVGQVHAAHCNVFCAAKNDPGVPTFISWRVPNLQFQPLAPKLAINISKVEPLSSPIHV